VSNKIYPKYKEHALAVTLGSTAKIVSPVVAAILVDAADYTYSDSHEFLSDVTSGGRVAISGDLANRTYSSGVLDADDATLSAVSGDQSEAIIIVVKPASGANDSNTRLVAYIDGKALVEMAANASTSATSVTTEDLPGSIASGATLTKISGTGPSTMTTTGAGSAGDRSLSVSAISTGITAGAVYEYPISTVNFPITPNGGDINLAWDSGANKIFAL
jgi:hypothetical protein